MTSDPLRSAPGVRDASLPGRQAAPTPALVTPRASGRSPMAPLVCTVHLGSYSSTGDVGDGPPPTSAPAGIDLASAGVQDIRTGQPAL